MSKLEIRTEQQLTQFIQKIESLGIEINASQDSFKIAVKATIQQAANIGRIAYEARKAIQLMPTQREMARILQKDETAISYKKYTFSRWVDEHTDLTKTVVYNMINLYNELKDQPDFTPPKDMSWRECLQLLTQKKPTDKQIDDELSETVEVKETEVIVNKVPETIDVKGVEIEKKEKQNYKNVEPFRETEIFKVIEIPQKVLEDGETKKLKGYTCSSNESVFNRGTEEDLEKSYPKHQENSNKPTIESGNATKRELENLKKTTPANTTSENEIYSKESVDTFLEQMGMLEEFELWVKNERMLKAIFAYLDLTGMTVEEYKEKLQTGMEEKLQTEMKSLTA